MSRVIAQTMFNPFMQMFLDEYCEDYPECTHAKNELKSLLDGLTDETATEVMELFLDSFRPYAARLKARDDTLFAERSCEFVQHLEINRIWWNPPLDAESKERVWQFLIGGYLIAEIVSRLPKKVLDDIETMIKQNLGSLVAADDFNKEQFKEVAESAATNIMLDLSDDDIKVLMEYLWEFITSDATPIFHLMPPEVRPFLRHLFGNFNGKSDAERQQMIKKLMPVMEKVKTTVGIDSAMLELPPELNLTAEQQPPPNSEENKRQRNQMVKHMLHVITELFGKHREAIRNLTKNPAESLASLRSLVTDTLLPTMTSTQSDAQEKKANVKQQRRQEEELELFGPPLPELDDKHKDEHKGKSTAK